MDGNSQPNLDTSLRDWLEVAVMRTGLYDLPEWGEILSTDSVQLQHWLNGRGLPPPETVRDIRIVLERNERFLGRVVVSRLDDLQMAEIGGESVFEYSLQPTWCAFTRDLKCVPPRERESLLLRFSAMCMAQKFATFVPGD
jgi:hypothetical protein